MGVSVAKDLVGSDAIMKIVKKIGLATCFLAREPSLNNLHDSSPIVGESAPDCP